ncbi:MAG: NAD(P)/FAD-dependent oxidoreductase [Thermodesulfobacteriota bacterium]|nr:NAD(P)/FAD-dependent oxidoreductase [Thermodesulfobacteriota bacterium]
MEEYDVIIIGGGPAGASTAMGLKNSGLKVLIIEKGKLPRYKMCSGMLFPDSLSFLKEHFGKVPDSAYCKPKLYKGLRMFPPGGNMIEVPLAPISTTKDPSMLEIHNIWRSEFDYWLVKESGATVKDECRFKNYKSDNDSVMVNAIHKDKDIELKTRYLVGADGGNSRVRDVLYPGFSDEVSWIVGFEEHCTGSIDLDSDYFYGFLDKSLSEFYAAFNIKDNLLIMVTAVKKGSKFETYYNNFVEYLKKEHNLKPDKMVRRTGCMINTFPGKFFLGEGSILLTGEAAGFINLIGEGISSALATGFIAGKAISKSMDSKDDIISIYSHLLENEKQRTLGQHELGKKMGFDVFF